jgi:hypothetical protein
MTSLLAFFAEMAWKARRHCRRRGDLRSAFLCDRHRAGARSYSLSRLCITLQPLQIRSHVGCVLVAQIAIFLQCLVDDVFWN